MLAITRVIPSAVISATGYTVTEVINYTCAIINMAKMWLIMPRIRFWRPILLPILDPLPDWQNTQIHQVQMSYIKHTGVVGSLWSADRVSSDLVVRIGDQLMFFLGWCPEVEIKETTNW